MLHSQIHLIWPSCREHVPQRHRLGMLANWDDLTREICTGERGWLTLSAVLEGNQTFTCSLSFVSALKITCGHHRVMEVLLETSTHLTFSFMSNQCPRQNMTWTWIFFKWFPDNISNIKSVVAPKQICMLRWPLPNCFYYHSIQAILPAWVNDLNSSIMLPPPIRCSCSNFL